MSSSGVIIGRHHRASSASELHRRWRRLLGVLIGTGNTAAGNMDARARPVHTPVGSRVQPPSCDAWQATSLMLVGEDSAMRFVGCSLFLCLVLLLSCADDDATKPDVTPPGRVEDLAVVDSTGGVIMLVWTAPGDDGDEGRAARYDIRCSFALASEAEWSAATAIGDSTRIPKAAGETESLTGRGPWRGHVAVRLEDGGRGAELVCDVQCRKRHSRRQHTSRTGDRSGRGHGHRSHGEAGLDGARG